MDVKIYPSTLQGNIDAEPYKAVCLRAIIASAFACDKTELAIRGETEDIVSTINCLSKMGAEISSYMGKMTITPIDFSQELSCEEGIDVGDSVVAFRFLAPAFSVLFGGGTIMGKAKLPQKPTEEYLSALSGVGFTSAKLPLKLNGKLKGGHITVKASIGSQAISGILMALPLLKEDAVLTVKGDISSSYLVDLTISIMQEFGVTVVKNGNTYSVSKDQEYTSPKTIVPEGDYGLSAYFLCAGKFGGGVSVTGLKENTLQPEKDIYSLIETCASESVVSLKSVPDLIYPFTVLACYKNGITTIVDAERKSEKKAQKYKEFISQLTKMGATLTETESGVIVHGTGTLKGGVFVDSFGDAKIAAALAIASSKATEPTYLLSAEAVTKSYPSFFNDFVKLGGKCQAL